MTPRETSSKDIDSGIWYQSASSGMWYTSKEAAGEVCAIRNDGKTEYMSEPGCETKQPRNLAEAAVEFRKQELGLKIPSED